MELATQLDMQQQATLEIGVPHNDLERANLNALAEYLGAIYFAN